MSLISYTPVVDGATATAASVNTPLSTIYNDYNGNITDANIASTAAISGTKLAANAITADKLATNAITLASISSSTSQGSIGASDVLVTGLTTTVTIPAGGRRVRVEALIPWATSTNVATVSLSIYNSATVTGSPVQNTIQLLALAGTKVSLYTFFEHTPAAGSQSYCVALNVDAGTGATVLSATRLAYLTVKVV